MKINELLHNPAHDHGSAIDDPYVPGTVFHRLHQNREQTDRDWDNYNKDEPVKEGQKALPPGLVGSGKDFRAKPGVNRSGKQPGKLVGSGKPMKVKAGFVGSG